MTGTNTHKTHSHFDVIIVGQGLAGSFLAWEMINAGQQILVIDNHHHGSSSKVAAGIINPITGHRINLTSGFVEFLDIAKTTYQQLAQKFGQDFLKPIDQQRLIKNPGQQNYYLKRLEQEDYHPFVHTLTTQVDQKSSLLKNAEFGIGNIQQSYRVDTQALLKSIGEWLTEQDALWHEKLDYQDIQINNDNVQISAQKKVSANKIIFCEGFQAINNPWLKNLPFKCAKGDILTVQLDQASKTMLNWGHWLLPTSKETQQAYLGSTYHWQDMNLEPDNTLAKELIDSLEKHTTLKATMVDHRTGIRPTTINRKQLIGLHPQHKNLYCFNGFGSKGCLTIPHYAKLFTRHFSHQQALSELMPEIDTILSVNSVS